jgi:tryptophan synthase alpha chain
VKNRLEQRVREMRAEKRRGLAPFVTAGDGGMARTLDVLLELEKCGAACVELGLPFSDPIADGPVLQAAAQRALEAGATFDAVLEMVAQFRARGGAMPIVLMGYANPLLKRTWSGAARALARAGVDGLLVADLPVEEGGAMASAALDADLCPIFFAAPTSSDERIAASARASRGFLYTILRTGVTGRATEFDAATEAFLARVRELAGDLALAIGFGIRDAAQVRAATRHAELAIVGSALVEHLHNAREPVRAAREFVTELQRGLTP